MKWKMISLFLLTLFIFLGPVSALEVAEEEIGSEEVDIEFENYQGPYDVVLTLEEIFGIGRTLGKGDRTVRSVDNKYTIIHAVDPEEEQGYNADIFILEREGYVDHIINVRRILAGYLEEAYNYIEDDAMLLAKFITYYNAVHRGDKEYISGVYTKIVVDVLEEDKIGIAKSYRDWPGKTMILIPLTEKAEDGGLGSLDSDELSDEEVIEDLRERDDMGLDDRKNLVDLKEREIEEEETAIEEERKEIEEAEARQEETEETEETITVELELETTLTEREPPEIEEEEPVVTGVETEDTTETEEPAAVREENEPEPEITATTEDTGVETEETDERPLEERREELQEREERLEERRENLEEERELITEDQQEIIDEEEVTPEPDEVTVVEPVVEPEPLSGIPFMLIKEEQNKMHGTLVLVDFTTGAFAKTSSVTTILGRQYYPYQDSFLIVYEGNGTVKLGVLDTENLTLQAESTENVYGNTYVLIIGSSIYAAVQEGAVWKLGKFNSSLELEETSSRSINPYTLLIRQGEYIYGQDDSGTLTAFNEGTLE